MPKTTALADEIINGFLRNTAVTLPATVFVALFTASPGVAGSVANEVAAGVGYARASAAFGASSSGFTSNTGVISFGPDTTTNWGTLTHFGLCKAGTRGVADLMYFAALTASQVVSIGQSGSFAIGALTVTEA